MKTHSYSQISDWLPLLSSIWENSVDGMRLIDGDGITLAVNPAFCKMVNMTAEELVGNPWSVVYSDSTRDYIFNKFKEQLAANQIQTYSDEQMTLWNGEVINASLSNSLIRTGEGQQYLFNIYRDISARKEAEQALVHEKNRLELLLKHERLISEIASRLHSVLRFEEAISWLLPIISNTLETEKIMLYICDNKFKKLTLLSAFSGESNSEKMEQEKCIAIADYPWLKDIMNQRCMLKFSTISELQQVQRAFFDRSDLFSAILCPVLLIDKETLLFIFGNSYEHEWPPELIQTCLTSAEIIANAWERYSYFCARINAEKKQAEMIQAMEKTASLASIGVITAGIAHEVNQPLNAIKVVTDSVLYWDKRNKGYLPEMIIEKLQKISSGVDRIDRIIRHMRSFYVEPGRRADSDFDLNKAICSSITLIDRQISAHGIELSIELCSEELPIQGNYTHIEQIVLNLVSNALHALDVSDIRNKKIILKTSRLDNHAKLEIEDNGIGISREEKNKIFEPFYTTKAAYKNMGIGLAIVKRFVEEHRGKISFKSTKREGTVFTIKIPLLSINEEVKVEDIIG